MVYWARHWWMPGNETTWTQADSVAVVAELRVASQIKEEHGVAEENKQLRV